MHMGYSTLCILFQRASSPFAGRSGTNEGGGVGQQRQRSEKIGNARARAHTHTHTHGHQTILASCRLLYVQEVCVCVSVRVTPSTW